MKKLLDRLGSPDAISWVNFAVIFVLQMAGSTISSLVDFSGRSLEFYSLRVFVLLCLIPIYLLGRLALNKFAKTKPKPFITLATFLVAMVTTSFLFDYVLFAFDFTNEAQGFRRLTTVAFGFLASSILSSLLVTYAREFARENQKLITSAKNLVDTKVQAGQRIANRQAELIESIRSQIDSALNKVRGHNIADDTLQIRALIDDVVRPISYDLARNVKGDTASSQVDLEPKVDWLKVNSHALKVNPFHFLATPIALSIIIAPFLVANFQVAGAISALVFGVVFLLLTMLASYWWPKLPTSLPDPPRVILFSTANSIFALAAVPVIAGISSFNLFEPLRIVAWVVLCNLIAWTVALVLGTLDLLKITNSALLEAVDDLKREVILLNGSYRELQQGISRALHGPVQEAITSALLKLQSSKAADSSALAEELRQRIAKSLEVLESPNRLVSDVEKVLDELKELWSDAVEITVTLDQKDLLILRSHPWTSNMASELAREACSNAIRHGNATQIFIQIKTSLESQSVVVKVENKGEPIPENPRIGLGSQLFDEVSLDWSRKQIRGGVIFEARLPLLEAAFSSTSG